MFVLGQETQLTDQIALSRQLYGPPFQDQFGPILGTLMSSVPYKTRGCTTCRVHHQCGEKADVLEDFLASEAGAAPAKPKQNGDSDVPAPSENFIKKAR